MTVVRHELVAYADAMNAYVGVRMALWLLGHVALWWVLAALTVTA